MPLAPIVALTPDAPPSKVVDANVWLLAKFAAPLTVKAPPPTSAVAFPPKVRVVPTPTRLLTGAPEGDLLTLPDDPRDTAIRASEDVRLRPEAAAVALYAAIQVRTISGAPALRVTRADDGGWTFRVSRRYASERQAQAFQYVLDRLQVLNAIAW